LNLSIRYKKSLKIPKGYSESVNRRRTDNIMARGKKNKKTNNDLPNITHKTKDRVTRTTLKTGVTSGTLDGQAVPVPLVTPVQKLTMRF
jgi:hypothetical protein